VKKCQFLIASKCHCIIHSVFPARSTPAKTLKLTSFRCAYSGTASSLSLSHGWKPFAPSRPSAKTTNRDHRITTSTEYATHQTFSELPFHDSFETTLKGHRLICIVVVKPRMGDTVPNLSFFDLRATNPKEDSAALHRHPHPVHLSHKTWPELLATVPYHQQFS
jgi:hypothetical protein